MYGVSSNPSEHEVANGEEDNTEQGWDETMFRGAETVLLDVGDEVPELIDEEASHADQAGDADSQEA